MPSSFERRIDAKLILSILACGLMSFSGVVVETAMNVTFPSLMTEFGVSTALVQWVTTGYLLVLTAIMPLSSLLKRRFRTKTLFLVAIVLFIVGTITCALASAFPMLIAGRVVQGLGTGLALPLMFNIVIEQAPLDRMGMMMGVATLITASAPAVGPSAGGLIVTLWGWRTIFWALLPLLAISLVAGLYAIRQVSETQQVKFSPAQFAALAGGFVCLVFATSSASTAGWLSAQVLGLFAAAVALLAAFVALSSRSENPLIRVAIFRNRRFVLCLAYMVLFQAIVLGLGYLIPYYGQVVCGQNAFDAGCLLLPGCIIGAILAPIGGRFLDILGARKPLTIGAGIQLLSMVLFIAVALGNDPWVFMAVYFIVPIAQGLSMSNSMTTGLTFLPESLKTDGNATFTTLQQLGGALGTAVCTSIVNASQTANAADMVAGTLAGTELSLYVLLGVSVVAAICIICVFVGKKSGKQGEPQAEATA